LISESFDTCGFSPGWDGSFVRTEFYPSGMQPFVEMSGHGCVLQQYIPVGVDDITSAQVGLESAEGFTRVTGGSEVDEFYVEWQEYYPDDHDFADGAQKLFRFTYWKEGESRGPTIHLMAQYENTDLQLAVFHPDGDDGNPIDLFTDTHLAIPTGRWVDLGVWCRLNTPGESDGFCRAYLDGQEVANMDQISIRGNDTRGFNIMWVGGNHTNQKPTVHASSRFIDNIRWFNTKP
jgi:hypothetical protein